MGKKILFSVLLAAAMVMLTISPGGSPEETIKNGPARENDPPTRLTDLIMDMNVSEEAEGSFQGEHSMPVFYELSLSGSGDVNGDGIDDLLIGSWGNNEGGDLAGQTYLIFGKTIGWSNDVNLTNADASFIGEEDGNRSGRSVAIAGDVNGDGFDDILIGAYGGTSWTYLIFGRSSGWSMDTDLTDSDASFGGESDYAGMSVSGAGDVNDDGYDDFLIGAMAGGVGLQGKAYLFLGKSSGWVMNTPISTGASASFLGEAADDNAGISVSGAGDVNGDGFDDILIGANNNDEGGINAGQTYLILGKDSGWAMDINLSTADASFIGENVDDLSGYTVKGAGDVDGDGYDDFLISAEGNDEGGLDAGQTYLVLGKGSGWAKDTDLSASDASFIGENEGDWASFSLSGAGDVDGDRLDDILIGAPGNDEGGISCGQTYLILGGSLSMDTNLSAADGSFIGENGDDRCGNFVTGGCDLNGDGCDDIVIASPTNDENGDSTGETYVITGFGNSEPLEVYSLVATDGIGNEIQKADIGDTIDLELIGLDSNDTHQDSAIVNITFEKSFSKTIRVPLRETGLNTGIYRGKYLVPLNAVYFDQVNIYSRKDPTKQIDLRIDYPFRPHSVSDIGLFIDAIFSQSCDKADFLDTVYIEVNGQDANTIKIDKAFVNISSDKNSSLHQMLILMETGAATGTYRGSMGVSYTMEYFENITITSVETETIKAQFMVHTPIQLRMIGDPENALEDSEYSVTFYNFGYSPAIWDASFTAPWLTWDIADHILSGTPDNRHVGLWDFRVNISDLAGHSNEVEFQITVVNALPRFTNQPLLEATEDVPYYVDLDSDDEGLGTLSWDLITNAKWLSIDPVSGELEGIPSDGDVGIMPVTISLDDGNSGWNVMSFDLNVIGINDMPLITTSDVTTVVQGDNYYRDYEVLDPDMNDTHSWSLSANASWLSLNSTTGELKGAPGKWDVGTFLVDVKVTDLAGDSDHHEFNLTVENINDKPEWSLVPDDMNITHGQSFSFDVDAIDPDPDTTIEYSVQTTPESDMDIDPETGELEWVADVSVFDSTVSFMLDVSLKASDGEAFSIYEFKLTVIPTEPPVASLIKPAKSSKTPSTYSLLEWTGSDPENEPITYTIYIDTSESFVSGMRAECFQIEETIRTSLNITGLALGSTYYWTVVPYDGCSRGACDNGPFSFKVNNAPTLEEVQDQKASSGSELVVKVSGSDPDTEDRDSLRYYLSDAPEGMEINEETGKITWTPSSGQTGFHEVTVKFTDGIETATISFEVDVGKGKEQNLLIFLIIAVLIIIIVLLVLWVVLSARKKKEGKPKEEEIDEETREIAEKMQEHLKERAWEQAHYKQPDGSASPSSFVPQEPILKEISGKEAHRPAPKKAEGEYREKPALKEVPEPELEEEIGSLDNLIAAMPKEVQDIEVHGQPLEPDEIAPKAVENPYDHQGATAEEIEKK